jgi:hypothetical protein
MRFMNLDAEVKENAQAEVREQGMGRDVKTNRNDCRCVERLRYEP